MRARAVLHVCRVSITHEYKKGRISRTTAGAQQITPQQNRPNTNRPALDQRRVMSHHPDKRITSDNAKQIRAQHIPCYAMTLSNMFQRGTSLKCKGESSRALATPAAAIKAIADLDPVMGPAQNKIPTRSPNRKTLSFISLDGHGARS